MLERDPFEAALATMEKELERVRAIYEQYFQGLERVEPLRARDRLERTIRELRRNQTHNTALRFRLQTLVQRFTTLKTYWTRVGKQIEEGTFRRDLQRAKRRQETQLEKRSELGKTQEIDVSVVELAKATDASLSPTRLRQLHQDYNAVQRQLGANKAISLDGLACKIEALMPKIIERYGTSDIDFRVVQRDGRVGLKPYIRKPTSP